MCELFAFSGTCPVEMNPFLKTLAAHGEKHPHGWGMAIFYGKAANLEKEPYTAQSSFYLHQRLMYQLEADNMMAHIRLATRGKLSYVNTHPFMMRDASKNAWTLIHNGTIFESEILDQYKNVQEGNTDSERILYHVIARMNQLAESLGHYPDERERFVEMDAIIQEITPHNKVNLILYDGEQFFVHTNMRETLYMKKIPEGRLFATVPLDEGGWEAVPFMQLLAFKEGKLTQEGTKHQNEYIQNATFNIMPSSDYSYL